MFQAAHLKELSAAVLVALGLWGGINTIFLGSSNIGFAQSRPSLNSHPMRPNESVPLTQSSSPVLLASPGASLQAGGNRICMPTPGSQHSAKNSGEARYLGSDQAAAAEIRSSERSNMDVAVEFPEDVYKRAAKLRERTMILSAPASLRGDALPFYLETVNLFGAFGMQQIGGSAVEGMTESSKKGSVGADRRTTEINALLKAGELFLDAMDAELTHDPESSDYADWWAAARQRAENHLRLALGWDRFNTLSARQIEILVNAQKLF